MKLTGKNIVVTGAAGGIGAALARRFHAGGANVVLSDRDGLAVVKDQLPGSVEVIADIGTEAGNIHLIKSAQEAFGPIDLFFANAGVGLGGDPMAPEEHWETSMNVNFHAHRWAARHLLPDWLERGEGYFCSTASAAGLLAQIGSATYSVSKHAAVAFAEWMSITYGDKGLRVSCLCPQGVNTNMLNASDGLGNASGGDVVRASGAVLEPADVADIVADAIEREQFLILPHPEVAGYLALKATEPERWLGGMRKLQRRVMGA